MPCLFVRLKLRNPAETKCRVDSCLGWVVGGDLETRFQINPQTKKTGSPFGLPVLLTAAAKICRFRYMVLI
jgi:hypothetical protein